MGRLVSLHLSWLIRETKTRRLASRAGARLPPGLLRPRDNSLRVDQRSALAGFQRHGPVFKLVTDGQWTTCIVGLSRGRRLLAEHGASLPGVTLDLNPLFPGGALRGMEGEAHTTYRRVLVQALQATPLEEHAELLNDAVEHCLESLAGSSEMGSVEGPAIRSVLREGMSTVMLGLIFGLTPSSGRFGQMRGAYRRFGPDAPVYRVQATEAEAFAELQVLAREIAAEIRAAPDRARPSMLRHMVLSDTLDETSLGNLINLFEGAHFDVYSLWHWLLWYLAREPAIGARLRTLPEGGEPAHRLLTAIIKETLRLNQSEVLLRRSTSDIAFDGFLIPGGSTVRVCLWESHKEERVFPDPFRFDPDRFLQQNHDIEEFAPFGLDKRRCIGGDVTFAASSVFVERLLRDYEMIVEQDGPAVRGKYHWEPNPRFAVRVMRRTEGPKDLKT